jgi:hypothetical protein
MQGYSMPEWEAKQAENRRLQEAERKQQLIQDAYTVQQQLMAYKQGDPRAIQSAEGLLQNRLDKLREQGIDSTETFQMLQQIRSGDVDSALRDASIVVDFANELGLTGSMNQMPAALRTFNSMTEGLSEDERERARLIQLGLEPRAGMSANERIAQDPDLMRAVLGFTADKAGATESGKDIEARRTQRINWGYDAAKGLPTAKRALELLQKVKTGGVDAIDIRTRQKLGAESADQGELANLLGKAVLSQLKATFGAQFTEKEGRLLMDIEAGINKGEGTNIRLLNQLVKRGQVYAKRAIEDATSGDNPDYRTAAAIQELLELDLGEGDDWLGLGGQDNGTPVVRSQADFDALPSGAIFIEDGKQYRKP